MKSCRGFRSQVVLAAAALWLSGGSSAHAWWGSATPLTDLLLQQGHYGSGVATLDLEDPTRPTPSNGDFPGAPTRELPTTVWYPAADKSADEAPGAAPGTTLAGFPLIVFGHGFTSEGAAGSFIAAHLATHGYVVVAPDFPLSKGTAPGGPTPTDIEGQAGDVIFLTLALQDPALQTAFPVASLVDFDRIGVLGYSLGGATMALAGSHPSIDAVATLAPATCPIYEAGVPTTIDKPLLILQGSTDIIVQFDLNALPFFDASGDPRHLITIDNGSHGGFLTQAPAIEAAFPTTPLDAVICGPLGEVLAGDPTAQACHVCDPSPLTGLQLPSTRQQELTRAGVLAFFDAYLRCRPLALAYLKHVYDVENSELASMYSGSFGEGLEECVQQ